MTPYTQRIVIEGNDGVGKSTLAEALRLLGFTNVHDRGEMSKATLTPIVGPAPDTVYILLTCPVEVSHARLRFAGKDMEEEWHTLPSLKLYEGKFQDLVVPFGAHVIKSRSLPYTLGECLKVLGVSKAIGMPSGHLQGKALLPSMFKQGWGSAIPLKIRGALVQTWGGLHRFWNRSAAYPQMVAMGSLDLAVVGSDALYGNPYAAQLEVIHRSPQGVRLVTASKTGEYPTTDLLRVVTSYPEWARQFFGEKGIPHTAYHVAGGVEAMVGLGIADVAFDIVETGRTLQEHDLKIIEEVAPLDACVIRRKA